MDKRRACMCNWPSSCNGLGGLLCEDAGGGCGGDLCVCDCGGERVCPGCDECEHGIGVTAAIDAELESEDNG